MITLKNLKILSQVKPEFVGDVVIDDDRIVQVGGTAKGDGEVYDLPEHYIVPGFIDAHSHLGMFENGMGFEGNDGNEISNPVTPELRAIDAINPFDMGFEEAYKAGVTTVMTGPGSKNVIGGQFVIINTYGKGVDDMIFETEKNNPAAMKAAFGENPKRVYDSLKKSPNTRMATASIMRDTLFKAQEYMKKKERAEQDPDKAPTFNFAYESLIPVLKREIPLKIHCHRADDILTAIRIANEFNIKFTLDHFTEGYLIADLVKPEFKKNLCGVIIGPLLSERSKIELKNLTFGAPRILHEAGIEFAMMTDCPVIPQQYLPVCMSIAVREGLPEDVALKAITINPAKICGIDDKVGTIETNKLANLAVFNGHPLDVRSRCVMTIINGKIVHNEVC